MNSCGIASTLSVSVQAHPDKSGSHGTQALPVSGCEIMWHNGHLVSCPDVCSALLLGLLRQGSYCEKNSETDVLMQAELGGWVVSGAPAVPIPRRECLWRSPSSRPDWLRWRRRLAGMLRPAAATLSRRCERRRCHASCASSFTPHDNYVASLPLVSQLYVTG